MGPVTEHPVEVSPQGHTIQVPDGEALMPAAQRLGFRWPNVCGGQANCGVCFVLVEEGIEHASPIGPNEEFRLKITGKGRDERARLACQMRVSGPMRVFKRGVRPNTPS